MVTIDGLRCGAESYGLALDVSACRGVSRARRAELLQHNVQSSSECPKVVERSKGEACAISITVKEHEVVGDLRRNTAMTLTRAILVYSLSYSSLAQWLLRKCHP